MLLRYNFNREKDFLQLNIILCTTYFLSIYWQMCCTFYYSLK